MKFGQILAARSSQDWHCISYEELKEVLKGPVETMSKLESFHQMLAKDIADVDRFFEGGDACDGGAPMTAAEMRSFAVLNYLAVLKILKKHDKKVQCSNDDIRHAAEELCNSTRQLLFKASFCTAITDSALLFAAGEPTHGYTRTRSGSQSSQSNACPVCFEHMEDPAILPCTHSFCRTCIANCAAQGISNCPLCRQQQSLEPANLEIQSILGVPADHYYPENQQDILRCITPSSMQSENGSLCFEASKSPCSSRATTPNYDTPPRTPEPQYRAIDTTMPPTKPHMAPMPPLMKALHTMKTHTTTVHDVLQNDPDAAKLPFFEHSVEPPLCCAIRLRCNAEVIEMLLQYGADVNAGDVMGRTPLSLLCSTYPAKPRASSSLWFPAEWQQTFPGYINVYEMHERQMLNAASILLAAGADPMQAMPAEAGRKTCLDYVRSMDNANLLQLLVSGSSQDLAKRSFSQ